MHEQGRRPDLHHGPVHRSLSGRAFSISKGLGLQNQAFVHDMLLKVTGGRPEVVDQIVSYIDNTNLKTLGWMGMVTLFATVISMVGTVEKSFNSIWRLRKGRTLWRKFTDFFFRDPAVPRGHDPSADSRCPSRSRAC